MDPRKNPQVVVDLHRMLHSLAERTAKLLASLERWDPLHSSVQEIDTEVRTVVPMVRSLLPMPDVANVAYDSGHRFAAAPKKPVILYIDDNPDRLILLRSVLQMKGYEVLTAGQGRRGLELFLSEPVDLVILDFHMPGMNGDAVAGKMRMLGQRFLSSSFPAHLLCQTRSWPPSTASSLLQRSRRFCWSGSGVCWAAEGAGELGPLR